jgi:lactoylglutathione lyase
VPTAKRLNHVHIVVADLDRSLRFYEAAFGITEAYRDVEDGDVLAFLHVPGAGDVLTLNAGGEAAGSMGGFRHFGFQVPGELAAVIEAVRENGGEFVQYAGWEPEHVAYVRDPDGYVIEIDGRPIG